MTTVAREQTKPVGRVPFLVVGAAVLAFLDMEILARHLVELVVMPFGFLQIVARPLLELGVVLCLAALYLEGATPRGPVDPARRRTGFKVLALCIAGLLLAMSVAAAFQSEYRTDRWGTGGSVTYPVLKSWTDASTFALSIVGLIAMLALPAIAMIAPPYIMRFGRARFWPLLKVFWRHRRAYGWRLLLLFPISVIGLPAQEFWKAGFWRAEPVSSSRDLFKLGDVLQLNNWFGPDAVALSAGIAVALLGLSLRWIGTAVGRALDTDPSLTIDAAVEVF